MRTIAIGLSGAVSPPQQARSRLVLERIVRATGRLLDDKPFEDIAMAEIAREAGVAVGTVYTRFPSKDALLAYVFEVLIFPKIEKKIDAVLSPTRTRSETLYQFTVRYLWAVRNVFLAHRATLVPLTLISRQSPDPEIHRFLRTVNGAIHVRVQSALLARKREVKHPDPDAAVRMAMLWLGGAMREKFLYAEPVSDLAKMGDRDFVAELARGVAAYLTSAEVEGL